MGTQNIQLGSVVHSAILLENCNTLSATFLKRTKKSVDKCKPFEEASSKVNHNEKTPEWWGIVKYGNDIDKFKEKGKWKRYII
jgi:hypothetical protein